LLIKADAKLGIKVETKKLNHYFFSFDIVFFSLSANLQLLPIIKLRIYDTIPNNCPIIKTLSNTIIAYAMIIDDPIILIHQNADESIDSL